MTAAAGQKNDRNDDQPDAVVVKQIAEAVIHNGSSLKCEGGFVGHPSVIMVCKTRAKVRDFCRKGSKKQGNFRVWYRQPVCCVI